MVCDHVLAVLEPGSWARFSITRLSLPLFALVLGALASRPLTWRRRLEWAGALGAAMVLYPLAGLNGPLLLLWLALGRLAGRSRAVAVVVVVVALVVVTNGWSWGSAPGEYSAVPLMALVGVGRLVGPLDLERVGLLLPGWSSSLGRRPLAVYVLHLLPLCVLQLAVG